MRLRFGGGFECFFWQCMASSVMIWPATSSSSSSFCSDGKSAEYLSCFVIVEGVETAFERFAVKRQNACAGGRCAAVEVCRVLAKDPLDIRRVQPLQNITDRCVGGWPLPADLESFVQPFKLNLDKRANAPVRVGSRHNRQNGKQQNIRQLIELALGATRVVDRLEARKKGVKRIHRNLPSMWRSS